MLKLAEPGGAAAAVDHAIAQNQRIRRGFPHSSMKGCPVCPSFFFALEQTGQLPLPTAELLKGPSLWPLQCYTHARVPSPQMRVCTPLCDQTPTYSCLTLKNPNSPHNSKGLFPCCHCKGLPERGQKQATAGWFVLDIHTHLAESRPLLHSPHAEGGGNTQWYPVITEPRMEIT